MRRNRIVLSMLAVATASGAVAGCAGDGTGDAATVNGRAALTGSLSGLSAGNYTFGRTGIEGSVHLPDGSLITQQQYGPSVLRTGNAFYMRYLINGMGYEQWGKIIDKAKPENDAQRAELRKTKEIRAVLDGKHWVRADEKKLRAAAAEDDQSGMESLPPVPSAQSPDVTGATALVNAVNSATLDGSAVTGTLDATKVDQALDLFTNDPYYVYGPSAQKMAYRAELDGQGRLTKLTVTVPGQLQNAASAPPEAFPSDAPTEAAEPPMTLTISKYGETAVPAVPEGVTDLDPAAYEMLTNDVD